MKLLPSYHSHQANLIAKNLQAAFIALSNKQKEVDNVRYLYSIIPHPTLNCVIQAESSDKTIQSSIKAIHQDYAQNNTPHCWWVSEQFTPLNIQDELLAFNYQKGPLFRGVHANIKQLDLVFDVDPKIRIEYIKDPFEFDLWIKPIQEGFQFSEPVANAFASCYKKLFIEDTRFISYIAYYENQLAGSITLFLHTDAAGLYNGAVLSSFRRKGIMLTLGKKALLDAKEKGFENAVSQVGKGTYNMSINTGFKEYLSFQSFLSTSL